MNAHSLRPARALRLRLATIVALALALIVAVPAQADTATVTVTAVLLDKFSLSISTPTADFGNVEPEGAPAGYNLADVGSFYVWDNGGSGLVVTVKSNRIWNGTFSAAESTGTSGLTIAGADLRYDTVRPADYSEAAADPAFTVAPITWETNHGRGVASYSYYYSLEVTWVDAPGTFSSVVTYSAM
ncbi:MAG: hypothetical protein QME94_10405 [Anaerolineae bacterium]|nr:hypothetical protein [Anaerolineae bacterium]